MDSSAEEMFKAYVLFVIIFITILILFHYLLRYIRERKEVMAKCGHLTKLKSKIFVEGISIPVDISEYGFIPDKCIDCLKKETLGDI